MNFQLKFGLVSDVKPGFVRVNFPEDELVSDWLPVLVRKSKTEKENWQLEINEHVVCLTDKHCEEGVCLGAIPSEEDAPDSGEGAGKFRKLFSDGTLIEYDKATQEMTVDVNGNLKAIATGNVSVQASGQLEGNAGNLAKITAPQIELTGVVKITGETTIVGGLTAGGLAISAAPGSGGTGSMKIEGTVKGNMTIEGQVSATDIKAGTVSLKDHKHSGIQPGGGISGPAL